MGIAVARASSQYAEAASSPLGAAPTVYTLAGWYRPSSVANGTILGVGGSTGSSYIALGMDTSGNAFIEVSGSNSALGTVTANTWAHIAGVATSTSSRTGYLNGVAGTPQASAQSLSGLDRVTVGGLVIGGSRVSFAGGDIAEVAIWNVALTADEVAALAKGFSPLLIRPASLVFYAPLLLAATPEQDLRNSLLIGFGATTAAPTKAASHPPIIKPHAVMLGAPATTTGATVTAPAASSTGDSPNASASAGATVTAPVADGAGDMPSPAVSSSTVVGSRQFDGSTQYLISDGAPVTDLPFSASIWFKNPATDFHGTVLMIGDGHDAGPYSTIVIDCSSNVLTPTTELQDDSTYHNAQLSGGSGLTNDGDWHNYTAVWGQDPDEDSDVGYLACYLDGVKSDTGVPGFPVPLQGISLHDFNAISVNIEHHADTGGEQTNNPLAGLTSHLTVWDVALSDSDVSEIVTGSPKSSDVRVDDQVALYPIHGQVAPEPDAYGGAPLALVGIPPQADDHPNVAELGAGGNLTITPPVADAAGAAPAPSVSAGTGTTVTPPAGSAAGDGADPAASGGANITSPAADAAGSAPLDNLQSTEVAPDPAKGAGSAPAPSVTAGGDASITVPPASGAGSVPAPAPSSGAAVTPTAGSGAGQAPAPAVDTSGSVSVTAPVAAGAGQALAPLVSATGSASVSGPVATGTGSAPAPDVGGGEIVTAPAASAASSAPIPTLTTSANVTSPVAGGIGRASVPTIANVTFRKPTASGLVSPRQLVGVTSGDREGEDWD